MAFLTEAANRGSISTGYDIDNSLKLEPDNTEGLYFTPSSTTNTDTFTFSCWFKRTEISNQINTLFGSYTDGSNHALFRFKTDDTLELRFVTAGTGKILVSDMLFRDTSAWYHMVLAVDTTDGTTANRVKVYINGEQITLTGDYPSQNQDCIGINTASKAMNIGYLSNFANVEFAGYIAEAHHIDGSQLASTDFGEYDEDSGIWKPKAYTGSYGTNGFKLEFKSSGSLGADTSGNSHTFTLNNITSADQATDTPTNNFCTLNPLSYNVPYTASQGNTKYVKNDTTYGMASGTHYVGAGKWYWEIKATDFGNYYHCSFGIIDAAKPTVDVNERGYEDPSLDAADPDILAMSGAPNSWVMNSTGTIANNGSTNSVDYTFYEGDILAFALDMDNGAYWMGNSTYSGVANGSFWIAPGGTTTSGSVATTDPTNGNYALVGDGGGTNSGTPNFNGGTITGGSLLTAGFTLVTPLLGAYHSNTEVTLEVNFGGFTSYGENGGYTDANGYGNFAYAVPSGFYSLCSKNIAEFGGSG